MSALCELPSLAGSSKGRLRAGEAPELRGILARFDVKNGLQAEGRSEG